MICRLQCTTAPKSLITATTPRSSDVRSPLRPYRWKGRGGSSYSRRARAGRLAPALPLRFHALAPCRPWQVKDPRALSLRPASSTSIHLARRAKLYLRLGCTRARRGPRTELQPSHHAPSASPQLDALRPPDRPDRPLVCFDAAIPHEPRSVAAACPTWTLMLTNVLVLFFFDGSLHHLGSSFCDRRYRGQVPRGLTP